MRDSDELKKDKQEVRFIMGEALRKLREERKTSQESAAGEYGISTKSWQRYEQGINAIPSDILLLIISDWGVSSEYFSSII